MPLVDNDTFPHKSTIESVPQPYVQETHRQNP